MNTVHFPGRAGTPRPRRHRLLPWTTNTLLWATAAVLVPAVLITLALVSSGTLFADATAVELAPMGESAMRDALAARGPADDAFRQQKANAKIEELPAQF